MLNKELIKQPFSLIINEELSSVEFYTKHLIIYFVDVKASLMAFTPPIVIVNNQSKKFGEPGFCDLIFKLISKKVIDAKVIEGTEILIILENQDQFKISLRDEDYESPEAANFIVEIDGEDKRWVW